MGDADADRLRGLDLTAQGVGLGTGLGLLGPSRQVRDHVRRKARRQAGPVLRQEIDENLLACFEHVHPIGSR